MAVIKPQFSDILKGALWSDGQKWNAAAVNEMLGNMRLQRMLALTNWRRFDYDTVGTTDGTQRVIYFGGIASSGKEWSQWLLHSGGTNFTSRDDWTSQTANSPTTSSYAIGGVVGVQYGTKQGLWALSTGGTNITYGPVDTGLGTASNLNTNQNLGTHAPFTGLSCTTAWPGNGTNARVIACGTSLIAATEDDGATWQTNTSYSPIIGCASPSRWVATDGTNIYSGATIAGMTSVYTASVNTISGVLYDTAYGRFRAWGALGFCESVDGVSWNVTHPIFPTTQVFRLGCSPDGIMVAAENTWVWGSSDGGSNWVRLATLGNSPSASPSAQDTIAYGNGRFVIPTYGGVYVSDRWTF